MIQVFIDEAKSKNMFNRDFIVHVFHSFINKGIEPPCEMFQKEIRSLRRKNVILSNEVKKWQQRYHGLEGKYAQLLEEYKAQIEHNEEEEKPISLETIDDYVELHMRAVAKNELAAGPEGYRYPVECHIFYVLLSFNGKKTYEILRRILHLPSYKQVKRYKRELLEKYKLNSEHPLDGSPEIINELKEALWDKDHDDFRCVLAIDAASINPQVSISSDGTVTGFTNDGPKSVSPERAKILRESRKEYKLFIKQNKEFISKYEFVVLLCPLDPTQPTIPISCDEANSGSATQEIKDTLEVLRANAESCGFNVIGYAFDGDKQYLDLTEDFINENILEYLWDKSDLPIFLAWEEYGFLCLFYDLLHIVKCDRYRKAKDKETCVWPTAEEPTISKDEFIAEGIPSECFIDSHASKMHDDIPLKLFTPQNCHLLFDNNKFDLCLSLLPSTYAIEAVMNETLSREQRINYLTVGFCIVALYYDDAIHQINDCQSHVAIEGKAYSLFNIDFCKKYLALCWSLSQPITEHKCVRLGSLGTHMLEHLFGNNRRMSKGDDTGKNFRRIIKNQLLSTAIEKELNLNFPIYKRHHSSGAVCEEENGEITPINLQQGFIIASKLISLTSVGDNWGSDLTKSIIDSLQNKVYDWSVTNIKDFLPALDESIKTEIPSLKSIGASFKGGLSNLPRYNLHKQIDILFEDLNDDEIDFDLENLIFEESENDEQ